MTPRTAILMAVSAMLAPFLASPASGARITRGPFLQAPGPDRIRICWHTDVETTTELLLGTPSGDLKAVPTPSATRTRHVVDVTGLLPDTRYLYEVRGEPASGTPIRVGGVGYGFRTSPAAGGRASRFWVVGDSGYQFVAPITAFNNYMTLTAAAGASTDGFLMLGDNAYDIATDSQLQAAVFDRYATLIRNTPLWCAFGNHDGYSVPYPYSNPTPHDAAFAFPTAGESGGVPSGSTRYYSFDHGDIHFICLDTFTPANANDAPGAPYGMLDWLEADLMSCQARWIVAFMHYGPYSKGSHDSDVEGNHVRLHVVPMLERYGVDLVLAAHSHSYERSRLIDGHYGKANSWASSTMLKQGGNGSLIGGIDATGQFVRGAGTGAYMKPAATGRGGTVYAVCGSSSSIHGWWGGSTATVSPSPHPVHVANLNLIGSMLLEVDGNRLDARYLDVQGNTRDDFTIIKGASYRLHPMSPAFATPGVPGAQFAISRNGSLAAENVIVSVRAESGDPRADLRLLVPFGVGQAFSTFGVAGLPDARTGAPHSVTIQPSRQAPVAGAATRETLHASVASQPLVFGNTPAASWFASCFGQATPTTADWNADPDGDGMSNLLEYALGGVPTARDVPAGYAMSANTGKLELRYIRPPGRSDLVYRVEASTDLSSWVQIEVIDTEAGPLQLEGQPRKVEVGSIGLRGFLRLSVRLATP